MFGRQKKAQEKVVTHTDAVPTAEEKYSALEAKYNALLVEHKTLAVTNDENASALADYHNVEDLQASADSLGFTGDVRKLYEDNKGNQSAVLQAMISSEATPSAESLASTQAQFLAEVNEDHGSQTEVETLTPKTVAAAVDAVMAEDPTLDYRAATKVVGEKYPDLVKAIPVSDAQ